MLTFRNKSILVTGASRGIGEAIARILSRHRTRLLLTARSAGELDALAEDCRRNGSTAGVFPIDLSEPGSARTLYDRIAAGGHRIDILINNAGFGKRGAFESYDETIYDAMVTLNVTNHVILTRLAVPGMLAAGGGGILNVASTAGFQPVPFLAVYAASKAFIRSFSLSLYRELAPRGIPVTCLIPGPTETDFGDVANMPQWFPESTASVEKVARAGLAGLRKGRMQVTVGLINKLQAGAVRLVPHRVALEAGTHLLK